MYNRYVCIKILNLKYFVLIIILVRKIKKNIVTTREQNKKIRHI